MAVPIPRRKLTNSSRLGIETAPRKMSIPPQPADKEGAFICMSGRSFGGTRTEKEPPVASPRLAD